MYNTSNTSGIHECIRFIIKKKHRMIDSTLLQPQKLPSGKFSRNIKYKCCSYSLSPRTTMLLPLRCIKLILQHRIRDQRLRKPSCNKNKPISVIYHKLIKCLLENAFRNSFFSRTNTVLTQGNFFAGF